MNIRQALLAVVLAIPGAATLAESPGIAAARSGIDLQYVDPATRPQDDFFRYMNGKWLDSGEIPADRARYGTFDALAETTQQQLRGIVDRLAAAHDLAPGSDERKIADLYNSFMDEAATDRHGLEPLRAEFARIDGLASQGQIPALIAGLAAIDVAVPIEMGIDQDQRESTRYAVYLSQGGLGLPDRDYYLKDDDARLKSMREAYAKHVARMLAMAGLADAEGAAAQIVALETEIARAQWTKVANRDPVKTYNKTEIAKLGDVLAGFDWKAYFAGTGVGNKVDYAVVRQPSYLAALEKLIGGTPIPVWRAYFKWHLINAFAPYLGKAYVDADFAFYGTTLRDIPENRPRWKRGVNLVEQSMGEALGRRYVAQYFPPQNKARMQELVRNLITAYHQSIASLEWMGPETRRQAETKLAKFTAKIGYPDRWRDYSSLAIARDDLVGNVMRARAFEFKRQISKLGKPIDRGEWEMTPQTVNAYYNPVMNEIVFPAAILQPPFFDMGADDAANYGGIGAVIGHEISHGFDDQGSQYDGDGNLHDWWTPADHEKFAARTRVLVAQYSAYSPLPGYTLNGELTLGENIADNSGLPIAYKAYRLALDGHAAPAIDGFSGEQRFCLGWAQVWRSKARDAETVRLIKVDPHSPPRFRADGALSNLSAFYAAFDVKPGDKMYLPPQQRVSIW